MDNNALNLVLYRYYFMIVELHCTSCRLFRLALRGPLLHNERPGAIWLVQYNCYFVSFELQFATHYLLAPRNGSRKHQGAGHKPVSLRP